MMEQNGVQVAYEIDGVKELLDILNRNNCEAQAADLANLVDYVHEMERSYADMSRQLAYLQEQIALRNRPTLGEAVKNSLAGVKDSAAQALTNAVSDIRQLLDDARKNLDELKNRLSAWAQETVADFKERGAEALDAAFHKLNVRGALEAVGNSLQRASERTRDALGTLDRLEKSTEQSREAHAQNRPSLRKKLDAAKMEAAEHKSPSVGREAKSAAQEL